MGTPPTDTDWAAPFLVDDDRPEPNPRLLDSPRTRRQAHRDTKSRTQVRRFATVVGCITALVLSYVAIGLRFGKEAAFAAVWISLIGVPFLLATLWMVGEAIWRASAPD